MILNGSRIKGYNGPVSDRFVINECNDITNMDDGAVYTSKTDCK